MTLAGSGSAANIHFFSECAYSLRQRKAIRAWLCGMLSAHGREAANLCYIFCSDRHLRALNRRWLKHDYVTDVLTFDHDGDILLNGDVYISVDRVRSNARDQKCSFRDELHRVMAHGLLHLLGHRDKKPHEVRAIRAEEDYWLSLRAF